MTELILHQYELSPYAEKIRLALGLKGLPWQSVDTPMVLPKPDHFELTGGFRRVPVLQIGADVYCDSKLIGRVLDQVQPTPPLSPPGQETLEVALSRFGDTSFMMLINAFFGLGGVFDEAFIEDRTKTMIPPGVDISAAPAILPTKLLQLRVNLDRIDAQLADGRDFLLGQDPCLADLSTFHPIGMMAIHPRTAELLAAYPRVQSWLERVRAIGHGKVTPISAADAIAVARDATPVAFEGDPVLPDGMALGDSVIVLADEFGSGTVAGTLAPSGLHEIAVRRSGARVGEVVVHFPREDYSLIKTG